MDTDSIGADEILNNDQIDDLIDESLTIDDNLQIQENIFLYQLPFLVFPLFETAHYLITSVKMRREYGVQVSRVSPVSSLVSVIISCIAGSILTNITLGLPLASALKNELSLMMITVAWLAVFFCPGDVVYRLVTQPWMTTLLWCVKEVDRMKKIVSGVSVARDMYPDSFIITALCGVFKGSGTSIIQPLVRSLCSLPIGQSSTNELVSPGPATRLCWVAAVSWVLVHHLPGVEDDVVLVSGLYNACVAVFLVHRLDNLMNISSNLAKMFARAPRRDNNNEEVEEKEEIQEKELEDKKTN